MKEDKSEKEEAKEESSEIWDLKLYVVGQSEKSLNAFANLEKLCEEHLRGKYKIEIIDLQKHPELAKNDQIIAIPTLVRKLPQPLRKIIGDLSKKDKVLVGLDIKPTRGI